MYYSRAFYFLAQLFQLLTSVSTLRNGAIEIPTPAKYEDDEKPSNYCTTAKYILANCICSTYENCIRRLCISVKINRNSISWERKEMNEVKGATERKCILLYFLAVPTVQVEALVGHTTKLPCQMNSTRSSDVFLVLWYVDLDGKPIYR